MGGSNKYELGTRGGSGNAGRSLNFTYMELLAKKQYAKITAVEPLSFLAQPSPAHAWTLKKWKMRTGSKPKQKLLIKPSQQKLIP